MHPSTDNVRAFLDNRPHVTLHERARLIRCQLPLLDLIGEAGTRLNDKFHIRPVVREQLPDVRALQRARRRQYADHARTRAGSRGLDRRLDRDNGQRETRAERLDRDSRRGIACHHDRLGILADKELTDRNRACGHELRRAIAVRRAARVADV